MAKYLPVAEIAPDYSAKPRTFKKHLDALGVPRKMVGRSPRFDPKVVEAYLSATPVEETPTLKVVQFKRPDKKKTSKSKFAQAL